MTKMVKLRLQASHVIVVTRKATFHETVPTKILGVGVVGAVTVVVADVVVVVGLVVAATMVEIPDVAVNPVTFREIVFTAVCAGTEAPTAGKRKKTRTNVHPTGSRE
jgi:hypothetical protein